MGNEAPLGTHNLWNTPGVELPGPFRALVRELRKSGVEGKRAFAVAWSRARHWAVESTNAETKAKWAKVVAQLEAARAKAKATPNGKATKTAHPRNGGLALAAPTGTGNTATKLDAKSRQRYADKGAARSDGSFPINNRQDLLNAIRAVGRAKDPAAAKRHIATRAKALGLGHLIPDGWSGSTSKVAAAHLSLASDSSSGKHDLVWFTKRSTPLVVKRGEQRDYPESYGPVTKRRAATAAEEKTIASGRWVRVDEQDRKPGNSQYRKSQLRPQLSAAQTQEADDMATCPNCSAHLEVGGLALAMPPALAKAQKAGKTGAKKSPGDSSSSGPGKTTNTSAKKPAASGGNSGGSSVTVPPAWKAEFDALVARIVKKPGVSSRAQAEQAALVALKRKYANKGKDDSSSKSTSKPSGSTAAKAA